MFLDQRHFSRFWLCSYSERILWLSIYKIHLVNGIPFTFPPDSTQINVDLFHVSRLVNIHTCLTQGQFYQVGSHDKLTLIYVRIGPKIIRRIGVTGSQEPSDSQLYSGVELRPWTFKWDLTLYLLIWIVSHINRSVHQWYARLAIYLFITHSIQMISNIIHIIKPILDEAT